MSGELLHCPIRGDVSGQGNEAADGLTFTGKTQD